MLKLLYKYGCVVLVRLKVINSAMCLITLALVMHHTIARIRMGGTRHVRQSFAILLPYLWLNNDLWERRNDPPE